MINDLVLTPCTIQKGIIPLGRNDAVGVLGSGVGWFPLKL